jgi:hypothetical protein
MIVGSTHRGGHYKRAMFEMRNLGHRLGVVAECAVPERNEDRPCYGNCWRAITTISGIV